MIQSIGEILLWQRMSASKGLNRRTLVAGLLLPVRGLAQSGNYVRVQIQPQSRLGRIPADFMGLGYEVSTVSERGLFSAANHTYVQLVRTLSPAGVIRIGGNTSDYASLSAAGPAGS